MDNHVSRRRMLQAAASLPAFAPAAFPAPEERYRLGVMATVYSTIPFDDAMTRIRKAGYRYISIAPRHAGDVVFAPELTNPQRARMLRRIRDHGLQPFLSLGGFAGDLRTAEGLKKCVDQLDLCANYEIPIMVGAGPWYYTKFPNLPKREKDWVVEVDQFFAGLEKAVRHAESVRVTLTLKPHTGITARARDCLLVLKRLDSPWLKIAYDAGNISYYEGFTRTPTCRIWRRKSRRCASRITSGSAARTTSPSPARETWIMNCCSAPCFPPGLTARWRLNGWTGATAAITRSRPM